MKSSQLRGLRRLARSQGVQLSYLSMSGKPQEASPEALQAVLGALGTPLESLEHVPERLRESERNHWQTVLEPVVVAWDGDPTQTPIRLPVRGAGSKAEFRLHLDDGEVWRVPPNRAFQQARREVDGVAYMATQLQLPRTPHGYHRLKAETSKGVFEALVISAPTQSYSPPDGLRRLGMFLPTYAAASRRSWGAGNISDWQDISQWAGAHGANIIAGLPLLAAFLDCPTCEPSPYSPASRLFWNEFYVDIERVPELAEDTSAQKLIHSPAFQRRLSSFRRSREIDYRAEMHARRQVLERLAARFFARESQRRREFERFMRERPEAREYAAFRAACDQARCSWHSWPERQRSGRLKPGDYNPAVQQYHAYVQWLAQEQISAFLDTSRDRGVDLYLDLPLGVHSDSFDVWRERDAFALRASVGAPPDAFFSKGQDWGFAPLHPQRNREQAYGYMLQYLRFQMRHTGLLRIDHVMGLHRLYWIPHGVPATAGAYVSYPAEELYAILSLESHRHKTTLVGENLGTVPPEVNSSMKRHALRQMYVVQFAQRPDPSAALQTPSAACVASINTHDMPTFAAHWSGDDITDRAALGLIPRGQLDREREQRRRMNEALVKFLRRQGFLKSKRPAADAVLRACLAWLSASPAEVVLVNIEDLWLEPSPQNVPGTSRERPNWRRKARFSVEQIQKDHELAGVLEKLSRLRAKPKAQR